MLLAAAKLKDQRAVCHGFNIRSQRKLVQEVASETSSSNRQSALQLPSSTFQARVSPSQRGSSFAARRHFRRKGHSRCATPIQDALNGSQLAGPNQIDKGVALVSTWLWLRMKQEGLRRFWSMFPLTRVPCWYRFFEPQPLG